MLSRDQLDVVNELIERLNVLKRNYKNYNQDEYEENLHEIESIFSSSIAPTWNNVYNLLNNEDLPFSEKLNEILSELNTGVKWGPEWKENDEVFFDLPESIEDLDKETVEGLIKDLKQLFTKPKLTKQKRKALRLYKEALMLQYKLVASILGE